jgi:hypothetical protein
MQTLGMALKAEDAFTGCKALELPPSNRTGGGLVRPDELARRGHPEGAVPVLLVVVLEPGIELSHTVLASSLGWSIMESPLKVITKASAIPFDSGLLTGVKHGYQAEREGERDRVLRREAACRCRPATRPAGAL